MHYLSEPVTRRQILDSSKLKEFADDNFKVDESGRKLSKWVENTVEKGEIAHYEQFLLFPKCFQKACFPGASKGVIVWEWVNSLPRLVQIQSICRRQNKCNLKTEILTGMAGKHCGKWRKCWLPAFSPFPTMFSKSLFLRVVNSRDCVVKGKVILKMSHS